MTARSICEEPEICIHAEAMDYLNSLLLDLKKQLLGYDYAPITMERLNEGDRHYRDLGSCREKARKY